MAGHDPLYVAYHDEEWGVPEYDDPELAVLMDDVEIIRNKAKIIGPVSSKLRPYF